MTLMKGIPPLLTFSAWMWGDVTPDTYLWKDYYKQKFPGQDFSVPTTLKSFNRTDLQISPFENFTTDTRKTSEIIVKYMEVFKSHGWASLFFLYD